MNIINNINNAVTSYGFTKTVTALELALEQDSEQLSSLLVAATELEALALFTLKSGAAIEGVIFIDSAVYSRICALVTAIVAELGLSNPVDVKLEVTK